jgi:hypothetical protein
MSVTVYFEEVDTGRRDTDTHQCMEVLHDAAMLECVALRVSIMTEDCVAVQVDSIYLYVVKASANTEQAARLRG